MKHRIHRLARRAVTAAAVTVGLSFGASALALDMNDILNLQAAGLDSNTIVTVIRSSTEPLTVTAEEVEQLRVAGVPQPVLDEICLRVGCGTAPSGPTGPGPAVGPDLQREIELQRQQEEERLRLERERMEAERERMREAIEAEAARESELQTAYQGLTIGQRYYRQGQYLQSAAVYREFLDDVAPAPGTAQYGEAVTGFVRAMYAAGYRHAIQREALEATLLGPTSPAFEEMFGILAEIANDVSFLDPNFERLTDFQVGNFSSAFQDEWNYFLGRFFWIYADYPRAMEFLARVSPGADREGQAQYLIGVMALEQGENRRAVGAFQNAIIATERNESDPDIAELANLAVARLAYEVNQPDVALYHYRKIPFSSARHSRAVFETAWTYTIKQDWNRAIGTLHSLHSPYYDSWFFPELYVLEAYAYLETCNLDAAQEAVLAFGDEVATLQGPVREFIAETSSPEEYWRAISTYYDRLGTPDAVPLPIEVVRAVLADVQFVNQMELIGALETEQSRLEAHAADLGTFGENALAGIGADLRNRTLEAGLRIAMLVGEFEDELVDWYVKSQEISIDVRTEILSAFDAALEGVEIDQSSSSSVFVLAQDWQYWPFEGEYWIDEVDAYRGDLRSLVDEATGRCMAIDIGGPTTTVGE